MHAFAFLITSAHTHSLSGMCSPLSKDHTKSKDASGKGCAKASPTCTGIAQALTMRASKET